jgi:hypothetical protein
VVDGGGDIGTGTGTYPLPHTTMYVMSEPVCVCLCVSFPFAYLGPRRGEPATDGEEEGSGAAQDAARRHQEREGPCASHCCI